MKRKDINQKKEKKKKKTKGKERKLMEVVDDVKGWTEGEENQKENSRKILRRI